MLCRSAICRTNTPTRIRNLCPTGSAGRFPTRFASLPPWLDVGVCVCWQGGDLRKALWQDAMDMSTVFDWRNKGQDVALAVARGLHFLHQQNVVHRCGRTDML